MSKLLTPKLKWKDRLLISNWRTGIKSLDFWFRIGELVYTRDFRLVVKSLDFWPRIGELVVKVLTFDSNWRIGSKSLDFWPRVANFEFVVKVSTFESESPIEGQKSGFLG
jgi:hypothetical protein